MATQIYKVRDPSGAIREIEGPSGASDSQVIARAKELFAKISASSSASQIPTEPGANLASTVEQPLSIADKIRGVIETPLALGATLAGGLIAPVVGVAGTLASGKYGTQEGIRAGEEAAKAVQYQPRTQMARDALSAVGEFMQPVANALPPTLGSVGTSLSALAVPSARQAASIVRPGINQIALPVQNAMAKAMTGKQQPTTTTNASGFFKSQESNIANQLAGELAKQLNISKDELISGLNQQGPQLIPGYQKTVPQLLQAPLASQLQRNLKTAGVQTLGEAEKLQQQQMAKALTRVAPSQANVFDAAQRAGSAIENYAIPARQAATAKVRREFEGIDPFSETALYLPITEMEQAASKYLGAGTFGTGEKAKQAITTAKQIGTEELAAVQPTTQKAVGKTQNLEQAVRAAGGLKLGGSGVAGELRDLGIRESGTTGLINNKSGRPIDLLAEEMYSRGFIPDGDPNTLLDSLRNGRGRNMYALDVAEEGMSRRMEASMGDAPGKEVISKTVPYQTVQNLRSSIGEAAKVAEAKGANKEAAALIQMVKEIDARINRAAGQSVQAGEYFPEDIAKQYRAALKMHEAKMEQFGTGPQVSMFRQGGDNQTSIKGAEIPSKFYSGAMSQADDMKAFKKLIGSRTDLMDVMKSFAITQAEGTRNLTTGNLGDKYLKWLASRTGANAELLEPSELATVNQIGKMVENQMVTESLGRVTGSDTAQKAATMFSSGMLDSKVVDFLANQIPVVKSVSGPILSSLRKASAQEKNEIMARLLANPEAFAKALKE